jgi:hypothetical protein
MKTIITPKKFTDYIKSGDSKEFKFLLNYARNAIVLNPSGEDLGLFMRQVTSPDTDVNIMAPFV